MSSGSLSDVIAAPVAPNCSKRPILLHPATFSLLCAKAAPNMMISYFKNKTNLSRSKERSNTPILMYAHHATVAVSTRRLRKTCMLVQCWSAYLSITPQTAYNISRQRSESSYHNQNTIFQRLHLCKK